MSGESWKLTLPCTRSEAEALGGEWEFLAQLNPPPSLVSEETVPFDDQSWRIVAYFESKPSSATISKLQAHLPSAGEAQPELEKLPEEDWATLSQQDLQPVHAGRFFVHTPENSEPPPAGTIAFVIPASRAFGTGGHETTAGCLTMIDTLRREGKRFGNIADIGTGTGLLAFAAQRLWPRAQIIASDIDPVSIEVSRDNAQSNLIPLGRGRGEIELVVASGTDHRRIRARTPYDLLIANILAGPLIELAPSFAEVMADSGTLVLAGLLDTQSANVISTYQTLGFRLDRRSGHGNWPCLEFSKRKRFGYRRPGRASGRTSQLHGDTGEW